MIVLDYSEIESCNFPSYDVIVSCDSHYLMILDQILLVG